MIVSLIYNRSFYEPTNQNKKQAEKQSFKIASLEIS